MTFYVFLSCCTRFPEQWLERIRRGKVMLRCVCSAAREDLGAHGEGEGRGILRRHAHSLLHVMEFDRFTLYKARPKDMLKSCSPRL